MSQIDYVYDRPYHLTSQKPKKKTTNMDTKTIYYVTEISGEYEDYRSIPIMAFPTKEAAEEFAQYKRDLESAHRRINKKVYRLMDKEKKKYKDGDEFYQHYDEILDKVYDQLVVNGTIDPNKHKRSSIEYYYSYDDYGYAVYDLPFKE